MKPNIHARPSSTATPVLEPSELGEAQKRAFGALLASHASVTREMTRQIRLAGLMDLEEYDVLLQLEESPGRRLPMTELAERLVFTPSGLSRLIDRLQREGLVQRVPCGRDRRRVYAEITESGLARREETWPKYRVILQRVWGRHLTDRQASQLMDLLERVIR